MSRVRDILNPPVNFCRLSGLGLQFRDTYTMYFSDVFLLFVNFLISLHIYLHIIKLVSKLMPEMLDITTVISVFRLHTRICLPPLMVILWQFKKHTLIDIVDKFNDLITPPIEIPYLRTFIWYSIIWLFINISMEWITIFTFHAQTGFVLPMINDYALITFLTCWMFIPIFHYIFIVKTVHLGVRQINERIGTIGEWKISRQKWK